MSSISPAPAPRGVTLIELMVTLAILGIALSIAGVAFRPPPAVTQVDPALARIAAARDEAIRSGTSVSIVLDDGGRLVEVTAYHDGSVLADSSVAVDRLTGKPRRESASAQ